jgi:penicillin-binding protein-related factor A (putative recombinase)
LLSTINLKIDAYVRSIPNFNRHAILSLEELKTLQGLHFAILQAQSLKELYLILGDVEDELLQVQAGEGSAEV